MRQVNKKMNKKNFESVILLLVAFAFTACNKQMNQTFIINPDGSGKMIIESGLNDPANPVDETKLKNNLANLISATKGADSWENLVINKPGNGKKYQIEATGYFSDINQVKNEEESFPTMVWTNKNGIASLALKGKENNARKKQGRAEAEKQAAADQKRWQNTREELASLAKTEIISNFRMPGQIVPVQGYKTSNNTATVILDGKKMLAALDAIYANKNVLIQDKMNGNTNASESFILNKLYGTSKPPLFKTRGSLKAFFDYKTEVARAKKNYPATLAALGIDRIFRERNTEGLFKAIDFSKEEEVRDLLTKDVDVNYRKKGYVDAESGRMNHDGRTPVILAVQRDTIAIVKMLVAAGADVNIADDDGGTPLFYAADNPAILEQLLKAKVNLDQIIEYNNGEGEAIKYTALIRAAEKGNVDSVKLLVNAGADVNVNAGTVNSALIKGNHSNEIWNILKNAGARE